MRTRMTLAVCALLVARAAACPAQVPDATRRADVGSDDAQQSQAGHGSVSIAYLDSYVNGFWLDSKTKLPNGAIRSRGAALQIEFYVADDWSLYAGIPYLSNRYEGNQPHCPTAAPPQCAGVPPLDPPHPESRFIDDGRYHGTWQDFTVGAAWHAHVADYLITPELIATIPSHDYVFFDNAAVGQRLRQLLVSATLAHQLELSNLYYKIGYGYAFSQKVLGHDTGYQRVYGEFGYFVNERWQVRAFVTGRIGNGYSAPQLLPLTAGFSNDYWYHHDQLSEHTYFGAGVGFDYDIGNRYALGAGIQREFFGETVFDFKYALELRLTKEF